MTYVGAHRLLHIAWLGAPQILKSMIRRINFSAIDIHERFHHHISNISQNISPPPFPFSWFFSPINFADRHAQLLHPISIPLSLSLSDLFLSEWVKMKMLYVGFFIVLIVLLPGETTRVSTAITCNPLELAACESAITSDIAPTATCCSKLKEQRPCLCQYLKDPNLQKLVNSPNARSVASTCGTPFPRC